MKKVLILAYDFPPYVSVGGLRPYSWSKYLHEYDVYPIVITRQWSNKYQNHLDYIAPGDSDEIIVEELGTSTIIRTPYNPNLANRLMLKYGGTKFRILRKTITGFYEVMQWFCMVGPKAELYHSANEYLKNNKVDAIIATGDPFILFKYASKLSREFNTPWIADFRDPWVHNKSNSRNWLLKKWNTLLEKKNLKNASIITTVSDFFIAQLKLLNSKNIIVKMINGFDPDAVSTLDLTQQKSDVLRIGFVGTISNWHPYESFLEVLSNFILENPSVKLEVNFYGINIEKELTQVIDHKYNSLSSYVNIYPKTPNSQLLKELTQNNVMLLFNYYSIVGTKIYDYFAIKRVILLCYANDPDAMKLKEKYYIVDDFSNHSQHLQEDLIKQTNAGYIAQDAAHLKELLAQLYKEFEQTGEIKCNTQNVAQYSRREQAGKLAEIVKELKVESRKSKGEEEEELKVESRKSKEGEEEELKVERRKSKGGEEEELKVESRKLGASFHVRQQADHVSRNVFLPTMHSLRNGHFRRGYSV